MRLSVSCGDVLKLRLLGNGWSRERPPGRSGLRVRRDLALRRELLGDGVDAFAIDGFQPLAADDERDMPVQ